MWFGSSVGMHPWATCLTEGYHMEMDWVGPLMLQGPLSCATGLSFASSMARFSLLQEVKARKARAKRNGDHNFDFRVFMLMYFEM